MFPFRSWKPDRLRLQETRAKWKPNAIVLKWSKSDSLSLESVCQNVLIIGAPGSSKTTSSGEAIAKGLLELGCGGLVLTAKPDEIPRWLKRCGRAGRLRDVAIFGAGEGFNFIDYQSKASVGGGAVQNVVDLLEVAWEISDRSQAQKGGGGEDGSYWKSTKRQLCSHAVVALSLGHGRVGPTELYDLVISAPRSLEEANSVDWQSTSFCAQTLFQAHYNCRNESDREDLDLTCKFIMKEFAAISGKTRMNIVSTFTSMIDVLLRSPAREMLCGTTTITPEFNLNGGITIMGPSLFEHGRAGALIQGIMKYSVQRAILRRNLAVNSRPVFIYMDEFQRFVTSFDQEFFEACRSFRGLNVCLTQNIPNLYAALGGEHSGKAHVDSILGNMNLKIMHANGDPVTNTWAATSIGHSKQYLFSANTTYDGSSWWPGMGYVSPQISAGMQETYEYEVQPAEFTRLRTGGRRNRWLADAIVFQPGQTFADTGRQWRFATFKQCF